MGSVQEYDNLIADGEYAMGRKDYAMAIACFEKARAIRPAHEAAIQNLIDACQQAGDYEKALEVGFYWSTL